MLTVPDQKEGLSVAYIKALAARAGFATSVPQPDRDSVDLRVMAGGPRRPALDLQLKATVNLAEPKAGVLRFRLPIKNYNDLRVETQTPRLLVVLDLPQDESQSMTLTAGTGSATQGPLDELAAGGYRGCGAGVHDDPHSGVQTVGCLGPSEGYGTIAQR